MANDMILSLLIIVYGVSRSVKHIRAWNHSGRKTSGMSFWRLYVEPLIWMVKRRAKFYWVAWSETWFWNQKKSGDLKSFATSFKNDFEWNRSLDESATKKEMNWRQLKSLIPNYLQEKEKRIMDIILKYLVIYYGRSEIISFLANMNITSI
jgi:hypothetical protein